MKARLVDHAALPRGHGGLHLVPGPTTRIRHALFYHIIFYTILCFLARSRAAPQDARAHARACIEGRQGFPLQADRTPNKPGLPMEGVRTVHASVGPADCEVTYITFARAANPSPYPQRDRQ